MALTEQQFEDLCGMTSIDDVLDYCEDYGLVVPDELQTDEDVADYFIEKLSTEGIKPVADVINESASANWEDPWFIWGAENRWLMSLRDDNAHVRFFVISCLSRYNR